MRPIRLWLAALGVLAGLGLVALAAGGYFYFGAPERAVRTAPAT